MADTIELCKDYWTRQGCGGENGCKRLHICRYFIMHQCRCQKCKFSHNVKDDHNAQVLSKANCLHMTAIMLKHAYKKHSYNVKCGKRLPEICKFYNGLNNGCKHRDDEHSQCQHLHICRHYIIGDCKYGGRCKYSHSLSKGQPKVCLMNYDIYVNESIPEQQLVSELKDNTLMLESESVSLSIPRTESPPRDLGPNQYDEAELDFHVDLSSQRFGPDLGNGFSPIDPCPPFIHNSAVYRHVNQNPPNHEVHSPDLNILQFPPVEQLKSITDMLSMLKHSQSFDQGESHNVNRSPRQANNMMSDGFHGSPRKANNMISDGFNPSENFPQQYMNNVGGERHREHLPIDVDYRQRSQPELRHIDGQRSQPELRHIDGERRDSRNVGCNSPYENLIGRPSDRNFSQDTYHRIDHHEDRHNFGDRYMNRDRRDDDRRRERREDRYGDDHYGQNNDRKSREYSSDNSHRGHPRSERDSNDYRHRGHPRSERGHTRPERGHSRPERGHSRPERDYNSRSFSSRDHPYQSQREGRPPRRR